METKLRELRQRFRDARSEKERDKIDKEIAALADTDNKAFSKAMINLAKETSQQAEEIVLSQKLKNILPAINLSYFAKQYFRKTPQWLYQRINGNEVNGHPAKFTSAELKTLRAALKDVSKVMANSATSI